LGSLDAGKSPALVGLASLANDSGTRPGGRDVRGDQAEARRALYVAALLAALHNPALKAFRNRLASCGMKGKMILTAGTYPSRPWIG
jgi:transposase